MSTIEAQGGQAPPQQTEAIDDPSRVIVGAHLPPRHLPSEIGAWMAGKAEGAMAAARRLSRPDNEGQPRGRSVERVAKDVGNRIVSLTERPYAKGMGTRPTQEEIEMAEKVLVARKHA